MAEKEGTQGVVAPARSARDLNLLHRIGEVLSFDMRLEEVLQVIVGATADLMQSKIVSILLYDQESRSLELSATQSLSPAYRDKTPVSIDQSVSGRALLSKKVQAVPDIQADPYYAYKDLARAEGIASLLCAPMLIQGRAIGTINSYSQAPRSYGEDEVRLLSLVAVQAAIAVENARLQASAAAMREDLETRKLVSKAKAMLISKRQMDEPSAHRFIQKESMNSRKSMKEVAQALLLSEGLGKH